MKNKPAAAAKTVATIQSRAQAAKRLVKQAKERLKLSRKAVKLAKVAVKEARKAAAAAKRALKKAPLPKRIAKPVTKRKARSKLVARPTTTAKKKPRVKSKTPRLAVTSRVPSRQASQRNRPEAWKIPSPKTLSRRAPVRRRSARTVAIPVVPAASVVAPDAVPTPKPSSEP